MKKLFCVLVVLSAIACDDDRGASVSDVVVYPVPCSEIRGRADEVHASCLDDETLYAEAGQADYGDRCEVTFAEIPCEHGCDPAHWVIDGVEYAGCAE
jgi:hypothetical protein